MLFVALDVAPMSGTPGQLAEIADNGCQNGAPESDSRKPLPQEESVAICRLLAEDAMNSGGGIRTPDTRIMIPLL